MRLRSTHVSTANFKTGLDIHLGLGIGSMNQVLKDALFMARKIELPMKPFYPTLPT